MSVSEIAAYSGVDSVNAATSNNSTIEALKDQGMDKEDFLKLLAAQLTHQDPTAPMDNKDLILQLSQFSTLEATTNLNNNMEKFISSNKLANATSMIGKEVSYYDTTTGGLYVGEVSAINVGTDGPVLTVGTASVQMSQIASIRNPTTTTTTE